MPNNKGGKNYKKSKHAGDEPVVYECLPDQMYGRVIKILGNSNTLVYCNDNKERICHIRGNMRSKVWINVGDIVLISVRDFKEESTGVRGRGDICAKYDTRIIYKLRQRDSSINPLLFANMENGGDGAKKHDNPDNEGGFEFDDRNSVNGSESSESGNETKPKRITGNSRYEVRATMGDADDSFNIDDI
jgi:initiation factor 1A